jgi:DNA-directed RNA polymerase specialized sigma24 family protein
MDMAGLGKVEKRFLQLQAVHGLAVDDIAEVFSMPSQKVRSILENAVRKYRRCDRRIKF